MDKIKQAKIDLQGLLYPEAYVTIGAFACPGECVESFARAAAVRNFRRLLRSVVCLTASILLDAEHVFFH